MSAVVGMTGVGGAGRGLGAKTVFIRSVDTTQDLVLATDANGVQIELPYKVCRTGRYPLVGQTWIADRALGPWTLAAYIGLPDPPTPPDVDPPDVDPPVYDQWFAKQYLATITSGATGNWTVAHGCPFPPVGCVALPYEGASSGVGQLCNVHTLDSVNVSLTIFMVAPPNINLANVGYSEYVNLVFWG